jgi:hypothetical protein
VIEDNNSFFSSHWADLQADFDLSSISAPGWSVYGSPHQTAIDPQDET